MSKIVDTAVTVVAFAGVVSPSTLTVSVQPTVTQELRVNRAASGSLPRALRVEKNSFSNAPIAEPRLAEHHDTLGADPVYVPADWLDALGSGHAVTDPELVIPWHDELG